MMAPKLLVTKKYLKESDGEKIFKVLDELYDSSEELNEISDIAYRVEQEILDEFYYNLSDKEIEKALKSIGAPFTFEELYEDALDYVMYLNGDAESEKDNANDKAEAESEARQRLIEKLQDFFADQKFNFAEHYLQRAKEFAE